MVDNGETPLSARRRLAVARFEDGFGKFFCKERDAIGPLHDLVHELLWQAVIADDLRDPRDLALSKAAALMLIKFDAERLSNS